MAYKSLILAVQKLPLQYMGGGKKKKNSTSRRKLRKFTPLSITEIEEWLLDYKPNF